MNHIKLFEEFGYRKPKMITSQEYRDKINFFGTEAYTQEEIDFFKELEKNNKNSIYEMAFFGEDGNTSETDIHFVFMQLYPIGEDDGFTEIYIIKLGRAEQLYIIDEPGIDKFECDEFEEVLGYLGSQTSLKFEKPVFEGYNKPRAGGKKRWSVKYKKSINCSNPRGFSQIQFCKRKKRGGKYKS